MEEIIRVHGGYLYATAIIVFDFLQFQFLAAIPKTRQEKTMPEQQRAVPDDGRIREGNSNRKRFSAQGSHATGGDAKKLINKQQQPEKATVVKMGKANLKRDLLIFSCVIGVLLLFSYGMSDIGIPTKERVNIQQFIDLVQNKGKAQFQKRGGKSAANCTMFLAQSSIPNSWHGIFAGRDYAKGEIVFTGGKFLPISLRDDNDIFIQQYAIQLKHHHLLANVDGKTLFRGDMPPQTPNDEYELRATKDIKAGDELLLPWNGHPRHELDNVSRLFHDIPIPEDYAIADEIIREEVQQFKTKRSVQRRAATNKDIEETLRLVYKTTRRFNAKVASLLPLRRDDLNKYSEWTGGSTFSAYESMKNKSLEGLEMSTYCMSYVKEDPVSRSIIATTTIPKGSRVYPVPLFLLPTIGEPCASDSEIGQCKINENGDASCLGHRKLPFLLCPLMQAADMVQIAASHPEGNSGVNVEFQWSPWNVNNKNSHTLDAETVSKVYNTRLSFDAVALRDIEAGEAIRVKLEPGSGIFSASLPEELVPQGWVNALEND